jgi:hypothetical protein
VGKFGLFHLSLLKRYPTSSLGSESPPLLIFVQQYGHLLDPIEEQAGTIMAFLVLQCAGSLACQFCSRARRTDFDWWG